MIQLKSPFSTRYREKQSLSHKTIGMSSPTHLLSPILHYSHLIMFVLVNVKVRKVEKIELDGFLDGV